MLLSTSSSERKDHSSRLALATILLLAGIAALLVGLEVFARVIVERKSKVQKMVNEEYQAAIHLRKTPDSKTKQILILGNSLVGQGIDLDALRRTLPPDWTAHRFWIYNTYYQDWYFGLRRLFAEGSRPDVVAILFPALHLCVDTIRGDYFSHYLMQTQDLLQVRTRLGLDRTTTANLLFARVSKFYAIRSEIRKVFLQSLMPDLPQMYNLMKPREGWDLTDQQVIDICAERLAVYRKIAEAYGSKLVLLVPPIPRPSAEHHDALRTAARRAGVETIIPMAYADVPKGEFIDDIHLSPVGAELYTRKLVQTWTPLMNNWGSAKGR
jgi:hypothetical protein